MKNKSIQEILASQLLPSEGRRIVRFSFFYDSEADLKVLQEWMRQKIKEEFPLPITHVSDSGRGKVNG